MIKLQNVNLPIDFEGSLPQYIAEILRISPLKVKTVTLSRRSVDARKKPNICFCDTYLVEFTDPNTEKAVLKRNKNASFFTEKEYLWKKCTNPPALSPIIVGSGPAGMFAALTLAKAGIKPIIIERGQKVDERVKSVESFWNGEKLNPNSNVQFGEGGAGTFSDGKLNTGIKDPRCRTVLKTFCNFGADEDILINAKPHIGTDILRHVVKNIRTEIEKLGGEYRFNTKFIKPVIRENKLSAAIFEDDKGEYELPCNQIILAIGNGARDTYYSLWENGLNIISKPFAIGVRIEHLQHNINLGRYGEDHSDKLPPAEYKLATHLENGRGVYTFCMCPGGVVVNSSSEDNTYVTNGMSYKNRDKINANSALLVGVDEKDFAHLADNTPFGGIELQKQIEAAAYKATGGKGVPVQTVGSLLDPTKTNVFGEVKPTVLPKAIPTDLSLVLPPFILDSIKKALPVFGKQIKGFDSYDAILTAPETRSSSPVRIVRDENFVSNICGIYPCGEGAGYAGGITSSAVDGIRVAESIIDNLNTL